MGVMDTTEHVIRGADAAWPVDAAFEAAEAVAAALPPADLDLLAVIPAATPWFMPAPGYTAVEHVAQVIAEAMLGAQSRPEGHLEWWAASGTNVTVALTATTGLHEATASHLVAGAVIARAMAGRDRGEDAVLRLAERAAMWRKGKVNQAVQGRHAR